MIHKPTLGGIAEKRYRNHPRYRGCVGHWLLREGAGLVAFDVSGYHNHGTLTAGPTWSDGQFGAAINCDGTDDLISIPNSPSLQFGTAMSLSLWTKNNGAPVVYDGIGGKVTDDNWNDGFGMYYSGTSSVAFFVGNGSMYVVEEASVPTTWTHLVGVYNGNQVSMYINGMPGVNTTAFTGSITNPVTAFELGRINSNTYNINGQVDDVRTYNRALIPEEVFSLYKDPFLEFRTARKRIVRGPTAVSVLPKPRIILQAVTRAANW